MGILLAFIARLFGAILTFPILIYSLFRYRSMREINRHYTNIAIALDELGNAVGIYLFNDVLILKGGSEYGQPNETISSVTGKNQVSSTLSRPGIALNNILSFFQKNHSVNSIDNKVVDNVK